MLDSITRWMFVSNTTGNNQFLDNVAYENRMDAYSALEDIHDNRSDYDLVMVEIILFPKSDEKYKAYKTTKRKTKKT